MSIFPLFEQQSSRTSLPLALMPTVNSSVCHICGILHMFAFFKYGFMSTIGMSRNRKHIQGVVLRWALLYCSYHKNGDFWEMKRCEQTEWRMKYASRVKEKTKTETNIRQNTNNDCSNDRRWRKNSAKDVSSTADKLSVLCDFNRKHHAICLRGWSAWTKHRFADKVKGINIGDVVDNFKSVTISWQQMLHIVCSAL